MNTNDLESSKFYSYKFQNFSTLIIMPMFILFLLIFISSFFAIHENTVQSIGTVVPKQELILLPNKKYIEGQELTKNSIITTCNNKRVKLKKNYVIHIDKDKVIALPSLITSSNIHIVSYIPASSISSLNKGQKIKLQIRNSEGATSLLNGHICRIGIYPTEQKNSNVFEIEATASSNKKVLENIRYGIQGKMTIITSKNTYFNYIKSTILDTK